MYRKTPSLTIQASYLSGEGFSARHSYCNLFVFCPLTTLNILSTLNILNPEPTSPKLGPKPQALDLLFDAWYVRRSIPPMPCCRMRRWNPGCWQVCTKVARTCKRTGTWQCTRKLRELIINRMYETGDRMGEKGKGCKEL